MTEEQTAKVKEISDSWGGHVGIAEDTERNVVVVQAQHPASGAGTTYEIQTDGTTHRYG